MRENPENKILVHCFAGRSRSVAIILAYLMYKLRIPLSVALLHVRQFRASANPNIGFINQLKAFENELFKSKQSFSFETLLDDLTCLIGPAKERLKSSGQWSDGDQSRRGPTGGIIQHSRSLSVEPRPVRGDSCCIQESDNCITGLCSINRPRRTSSGAFIKQVRDLLFIVLLAIAIVVFEHYAFPHYHVKICQRWSSLCESSTTPSALPRVIPPKRFIEVFKSFFR